LPFTGIGVDAPVVDPRRRHRHRSSGGQHLPLLVVAVAHHQTVARLVDLVGELLDVGGDFGEQRGREHLPGTVTNDLIQQRPTDTAVLLIG
jgi:hypothetical protein